MIPTTTNVVNRFAYLRPDPVSANLYQRRSRAHYFNLAAFSPTPAGAGRFGNAGVGILEGPGTATASLGLAKVFNLGEKVRPRFESTFNQCVEPHQLRASRHADRNPTFGVLSAGQTAENAGNRTAQLALRVEF